MSAEPDLLPLPERFSFMEWETHMRTYARACASSATEALRAEVERLTNFNADTCEGFNRLSVERTALITRAERLAEALREAKETMLSQVKWEACDCGCPQGRKPADAVSVTWLRAVQQVEIATGRAEEGK